MTAAPYADPEDWATFVAQTVAIPGGPTVWLGKLRGDGYGEFTGSLPTEDELFGPVVCGGAHRYAWAAHNGPLPRPWIRLPDGELRQLRKRWTPVSHHCDEPLCVDPACLYVGTAQFNAWDRAERRRGVSTRYGLHPPTVDVRGPKGKSRAIQAALRTALAEGCPADQLGEVYAAAVAEGSPRAGQLALALGC